MRRLEERGVARGLELDIPDFASEIPHVLNDSREQLIKRGIARGFAS